MQFKGKAPSQIGDFRDKRPKQRAVEL